MAQTWEINLKQREEWTAKMEKRINNLFKTLLLVHIVKQMERPKSNLFNPMPYAPCAMLSANFGDDIAT